MSDRYRNIKDKRYTGAWRNASMPEQRKIMLKHASRSHLDEYDQRLKDEGEAPYKKHKRKRKPHIARKVSKAEYMANATASQLRSINAGKYR